MPDRAQSQRAARRRIGGAALLSLCLAGAAPAPAQDGNTGAAPAAKEVRAEAMTHLQIGDTLATLLDHPAFAGFADRLLPWDDRAPDPSLPLSRIATLLPYHSNVDPGTVIAALNRMIDDAAAGRTVFLDIYSEAEKAKHPSLRHTGLFFYRGRPGARFAVISPGGGFAYVGSFHEGFPYAQRISERGLNAFVLKYRAGAGQRAATEDLARSIDVILRNAEALGVARDGYSLWGSSAGARMAASIGSHGTAAFGGGDHHGPAAVVMAYTAHAEVAAVEPSTYAIVGARDGIAPPSAMERRVAALRARGTEVAFRVVPGLGHGFGAGTETAADGWIGDAVDFWLKAGS